MEVYGTIQSGAGKGAFFMQVDWVVRQCKQMLGFVPFPGTLNIHISKNDMSKLKSLINAFDFELIPDVQGFCSAKLKKISIYDIPAAVVIPSEEVRIHDAHILEIISPYNIKHTFRLKDGNSILLSWI